VNIEDAINVAGMEGKIKRYWLSGPDGQTDRAWRPITNWLPLCGKQNPATWWRL